MNTKTDISINEAIIQNIKNYIEANDLSEKKIAKEAGLDYNHLWKILNKNKTIRLDDYVALCRAFRESLEKFIPKT